jgi:hypothetical protein
MQREISISVGGIMPYAIAAADSLAKVVQRHRNFILRKGSNFVVSWRTMRSTPRSLKSWRRKRQRLTLTHVKAAEADMH